MNNKENNTPNELDMLLQSLETQELRIHQLEAQLSKCRADDSAGADDTHEPATVVARETMQNDVYANRMIIAVQGEGNLKFALNKDITSIGREPDNDIQVRSRFVSRYHARIVCNQNSAIIEDLDSRNGLRVNTKRVSRKQLRSGDSIKVGRLQLQYIDLTEESFDGEQA
jgi:hypothetical protein